jgi:hypothetical protein
MIDDKHCLAPWTHTYLSPQSERRLCCASREPAQNFKQYIDTDSGTGLYQPSTLAEHWNSDHMRSVRRKMMAGETLPECEVCNLKLLNTSVYKDYFNNMFGHMRDELMRETDVEGYHNGLPVSYDYRITNVCSFTCRMCGPMLSSAWEAEERRHNPGFQSYFPWAVGENRKAIRKFQKEVAVEELWSAIKERRIREIYWVGGEPLDWPEHWAMMLYMVKHDIAKDVYLRYNTNLSRTVYNGIDLFELLPAFRDWQICASLDGTHSIGEYIRTGLDYERWLSNWMTGIAIAKHPRQMRIDLTLTLPGLIGLHDIAKLANDSETQLLTKVTFAFSPDIIMSPMSLPRDILDRFINDCFMDDEIVAQKELTAVLQNMLRRPTFQEQWPDEYVYGLWQGKARILELESRRKDSYTTMESILRHRADFKEWWDGI